MAYSFGYSGTAYPSPTQQLVTGVPATSPGSTGSGSNLSPSCGEGGPSPLSSGRSHHPAGVSVPGIGAVPGGDQMAGQILDSSSLAALSSTYPRLGSGMSMYGTPYPSTDQNPYPSISMENSSFYGSLASPYGMKDGASGDMTGSGWGTPSIPPTTGYYGYDHTALAAYGYGGGYDLAARRKNATRESTATLKAWLNEHKKNPYPTKGEKIMLAIITKMTLTQVSTWFANARRRLKKENKMTWEPKNKMEDDDVEVSEDEDKDDFDPDEMGGRREHGLTKEEKEDREGIPIPPSKPKIWSMAELAVCKTPPPPLHLHHGLPPPTSNNNNNNNNNNCEDQQQHGNNSGSPLHSNATSSLSQLSQMPQQPGLQQQQHLHAAEQHHQSWHQAMGLSQAGSPYSSSGMLMPHQQRSSGMMLSGLRPSSSSSTSELGPMMATFGGLVSTGPVSDNPSHGHQHMGHHHQHHQHDGGMGQNVESDPTGGFGLLGGSNSSGGGHDVDQNGGAGHILSAGMSATNDGGVGQNGGELDNHRASISPSLSPRPGSVGNNISGGIHAQQHMLHNSGLRGTVPVSSSSSVGGRGQMFSMAGGGYSHHHSMSMQQHQQHQLLNHHHLYPGAGDMAAMGGGVAGYEADGVKLHGGHFPGAGDHGVNRGDMTSLGPGDSNGYQTDSL